MEELGYLPEITNEATALKYISDCYTDAKGMWDLEDEDDRAEFATFGDYFQDHLETMTDEAELALAMSFTSVVEFISEKK